MVISLSWLELVLILCHQFPHLLSSMMPKSTQATITIQQLVSTQYHWPASTSSMSRLKVTWKQTTTGVLISLWMAKESHTPGTMHQAVWKILKTSPYLRLFYYNCPQVIRSGLNPCCWMDYTVRHRA